MRVAPKLLNCQINMTYFVKNCKILLGYFKKNEEQIPWKHNIYYNTISLSRHEQVCLMRLRFESMFNDATLHAKLVSITFLKNKDIIT